MINSPEIKKLYKYFLIVIIILTAINFSSGSEIDDIKAAEKLQSEGKNHEAIEAYRKILEKYPDSSRKNHILIKIARCYIRLGDDDFALKTYMQVITEAPDSIDGAQATSLMINLYSQRYQYNEVVIMAKHLAQQYPKTQAAAMATYRAAGYLYSQGKYEETIKEYEEFLKDYPESTMYRTAFNRLISLYIRQSKFDKAEKLLLDVLSRNESDTYLLRQLGQVYQKQGDYDQALNIYKSILKNNPDDVDVYESLGELYAEQGKKQKALEEWSKITKTAPGQYSRHQMLAYILKTHGFYEQAAVEYRKAIQLQPLVYYLYTQLADLYVVKRDFNSAISVYVDALEKFSKNSYNQKRIIEPFFELCKLENLWHEASVELQKKLKTSPDKATIQMIIADISFHSGNLDDSLQQFLVYTKSNPGKTDIIFERAKLLERSDKLDYAAKFYKAILDNFPSSKDKPYAMLNMGKIKAETGKSKEAISILDNLLDNYKTKRIGTEDYQIFVSANILMGNIYFKYENNVETALKYYKEVKKFIDNEPSKKAIFRHEVPEIYMKIASCNRILGEYIQSKEVLDELERKYPSRSVNAQIAKLRGDNSFTQGNFEDALNYYSEAVKWLKNEDWVNDSLERIIMIKDYQNKQIEPALKIYAQIEKLKKQGKFTEAEVICLSTLEIYPEADQLYMEMGELKRLQNKYDESIKFYQKLIDSESKFAPEALFQIALLYQENIGNQDQAMTNYSKLIEKYPDSVLVSEARKQMANLAM
ncbi:tetratricopeptide repeat protein [Candidatus Poribacteria bacterium]|nr:tetratricopeptide repeat protein [Candidatus Poribacteria bacterium]